MLVIDLNAPTPSNTLGHLPRRVAAFVAPLMDHHALDNAEPSSQLFRVSSDGNIGNPTLPGLLCLKLLPSSEQQHSSYRHISNALKNLRSEISKQRTAMDKAARKADAKRQRAEGPQQRTLGQTFSRDAAKKAGPSKKSATILNERVPTSVLRHVFIIGNLSPHDMCAVRCVNTTWREVVDDPSFMRFTLASHRSPQELARMATKGNLLFFIRKISRAQKQSKESKEEGQVGVPSNLTGTFQWCEENWTQRMHEDDQLSNEEAYEMLQKIGGDEIKRMVESLVEHYGRSRLRRRGKSRQKSDKMTDNAEVEVGEEEEEEEGKENQKRAQHGTSSSGWTVLAVALLCALDGSGRHKLIQLWMSSGDHNRGLIREFVSGLICIIKMLGVEKMLSSKDDSGDDDDDDDDDDDEEMSSTNEGVHDSLPAFRFPFFRAHVELRSALESGVSSLLFPSPHQRGGATTTTTSNLLTDEQLAVVRCRLSPKDVVKVAAFAGSGKTTTLVELARAHPSKRFLYLAFNVSVRDQAQRMFPENTKAKGIHQLAFAAVGRMYAKRLTPSLQADSLMRSWPDVLGAMPPEVCQAIVDTLDAYWSSSDRTPNVHHVPLYVRRRGPPGGGEEGGGAGAGGGAGGSTTTTKTAASFAPIFPQNQSIEENLSDILSHVTKLDDVDAPSVVRASLCVWKQMCSLSPPPPASTN